MGFKLGGEMDRHWGGYVHAIYDSVGSGNYYFLVKQTPENKVHYENNEKK